ncbi:MAG: SIMPL domain-containing protein [Patescibacteria group bacterium]
MFDNLLVQRLLKFGGVLLAVLTVYVGALALNTFKENKYIGGGVPAGNVITVSGEGEAFAIPDIAEISLEVVAEKATVAEAQEEVTTKMNAIIAYLKDQGIPERDIKTTNYSSNPRYEWHDGPVPLPAVMMEGGSAGGASDAMMSYPYYDGGDNRVLVGYEVRHSITVKIRDTEKAGTIVAGVGDLGATNMYGPNFTIDDEDALMREAREDAIQDAKEKAEQLAEDLDVRLVRIVSFSENGGGYYPMYRGLEMAAYDEASVKVAPELPEGEQTVNAYVSITYEIR